MKKKKGSKSKSSNGASKQAIEKAPATKNSIEEIPQEIEEPIILSEKDYLTYLEHALNYMPHHLLESNLMNLLHDYYTCPKLIQKQLNMCCSIKEREDTRLFIASEHSRERLKFSKMQPLAPVHCLEHFNSSDPLYLLKDTSLNIHHCDSSTLYSSRCSFSTYVEQFASTLMELISNNEEADSHYDALTDSSRDTLPESSIEFMKWMYTILRSNHSAVVLQKRPEEFPSLLVGRLLKDFSQSPQQLTTLSQEQGQRLLTNAPIVVEWMKDALTSNQLTSSENVNMTSGFHFSLQSSQRDIDDLSAQIHEMQVGKSWLIPFNRLTGMLSTKKYNDSLDDIDDIAQIFLSPSQSHIYYVRNAPDGGEIIILDRFFGTKIVCPDKLVNHGQIMSFTLSNDGTKFAVAFEDRAIYIIDAYSGSTQLRIDDLPGKPSCCRMSLDGCHLYVAFSSNINVYDLDNGEKLETLKGHSDDVLCMDINKEFLVTGGKDNLVIKWKLRTNTKEMTINTQYDYFVGQVTISRFNDFIVSVENNRYYADVWCANTGVHKQFLMDRGTVTQILMDCNRDRVFTVMDDKIWLWNLRTATKLCRINVTKRIQHVSLTQDGQVLFVLFTDSAIGVFDLMGGETKLHFNEKHSSPIADLTLTHHPITKMPYILSVAEKEKQVFIWNFDEGTLSKKVEIECGEPEKYCFTRQTGLLLVLDKPVSSNIAENEGRQLYCYDILQKDVALLWSIVLPFNQKSNDKVHSVCVSGDDKFIIICYSLDIVVVPIQTPTKFFSGFIEAKEQLRGVVLSPNGEELITSDSNGYVRKWSIFEKTLTQKHQLGRWRRNKCQCVYLIGEAGSLVVGSSIYNNWICVHERHPRFANFPQGIFSSQVPNAANSLSLESLNPTVITDSTLIQDIDNTYQAEVQQHRRIAKDFSASHIATTPDERFIISGDRHGCIRVWDIEKRLFICSYTLQSACTTLRVVQITSEMPLYVLLVGDELGNVTCLEACLSDNGS